MAAPAEHGGTILRAMRHSAGISQQVLAERSGVSVRSIRGLENGEVASPHTATLLALLSALDAPRDQAERFLRSWNESVSLRTFGEVMSADSNTPVHRAVHEGLMRSFLDKQIVAASRLISVGPDRRIQHEWYRTSVEALVDGVDNHLVVARGYPYQDIRQVRFDDLVGCSIRQRTTDLESNTLAVDLSLGESLRAGEVKSFTWREVNGWVDGSDPESTVRPGADDSFVDTGYSNAFLRPFASLTMQVVFHGEHPDAIWEVSGSRHAERRRRLRLDEFGTTSVVWQNGTPGRYGIAWDWD